MKRSNARFDYTWKTQKKKEGNTIVAGRRNGQARVLCQRTACGHDDNVVQFRLISYSVYPEKTHREGTIMDNKANRPLDREE
ncbi:MAG: hypothetical protein ABTB30_10830, partial [Clostridia bacterium]